MLLSLEHMKLDTRNEVGKGKIGARFFALEVLRFVRTKNTYMCLSCSIRGGMFESVISMHERIFIRST